MKIINKLLYVLFLIFISFSVNAIDTKAEQAVVIEFETGEILFEKNSNIRVPPASMTKIMTVYIAFDRIKNTDLSIKDKCKISPKAYKMGGSRTFLEIDDYVSIETLLRGIIIQSGNDASVALAECLSGTEENFSKFMNNYSEKIGLKNTNFINSSGWPDTNHYSTVKDLAVLSNALISQFPNLYLLFSEKNFKYNDIDQPNRNLLIQELPGVDGLKTGFTKKSGWGIAVSAIRNNRRISVVINGTNSSRTRLNEASNLINWAFNQTNKSTLIKKNEIIKQVDVWLGNKSSVNLIAKNDVISTISYDQLQLLKTKIEYTNPITAPIDKNEVYGKLLIDIEGKPIVEVSLFPEENIKKINPFLRIISALKYLIFGTSLDEKA